MKNKISRRNFLGAAAKVGLAVGGVNLARNLFSLDLGHAGAKGTEIVWYGHSFFSITTSAATKIVIDPYSSIGYPIPRGVRGDILTVSHEHFDHNNVDIISGNPAIIRGLKEGGRDWNEVERQIKDVRLYSVSTYHDKSQGTKRGKNAIFVYEVDDLRLAHLGDLGHTLTDAQVERLGELDLLFVPVGGFFTIDGVDAAKVVKQIRPRIAIPIHYKTRVLANWPGSDENVFLQRVGGVVNRVGRTMIRVTKDDLPSSEEIWVMNYEQEVPVQPDDKTNTATGAR